MGYQPVIDSYVDWYGLGWGSRKEVLAWGAGVDLIVRVKNMGVKAESIYGVPHTWENKRNRFDQHRHMNEWLVHGEAGLVEGRDDITFVNLLRPSQKPSKGSEYIVVGRASGYLDVVEVSATESQSNNVAGLVSGKSLRSASVSSTPDPLVATCMADSTISFYSIHLARNIIEPVGEIAGMPPGKSGRTWSTQFLRHDRLAVGLGPFKKPLRVYSLEQDKVSIKAMREFEFGAPSIDNRIEAVVGGVSDTSTVYSIAPIAPSSLAGGADGDLFLTGSYDGTVRYVFAWVQID